MKKILIVLCLLFNSYSFSFFVDNSKSKREMEEFKSYMTKELNDKFCKLKEKILKLEFKQKIELRNLLFQTVMHVNIDLKVSDEIKKNIEAINELANFVAKADMDLIFKEKLEHFNDKMDFMFKEESQCYEENEAYVQELVANISNYTFSNSKKYQEALKLKIKEKKAAAYKVFYRILCSDLKPLIDDPNRLISDQSKFKIYKQIVADKTIHIRST